MQLSAAVLVILFSGVLAQVTKKDRPLTSDETNGQPFREEKNTGASFNRTLEDRLKQIREQEKIRKEQLKKEREKEKDRIKRFSTSTTNTEREKPTTIPVYQKVKKSKAEDEKQKPSKEQSIEEREPAQDTKKEETVGVIPESEGKTGLDVENDDSNLLNGVEDPEEDGGAAEEETSVESMKDGVTPTDVEKARKEKENEGKGNEKKSSGTKEKGSKEKESREKESKEKKSKVKESKEKESKAKKSEEKESKEKESKEKESQEKGSEEKESKEKESKKKESQEKGSEEKESKKKESKEKESKEKGSKEKESKEKKNKEKESQESKEKESQESTETKELYKGSEEKSWSDESSEESKSTEEQKDRRNERSVKREDEGKKRGRGLGHQKKKGLINSDEERNKVSGRGVEKGNRLTKQLKDKSKEIGHGRKPGNREKRQTKKQNKKKRKQSKTMQKEKNEKNRDQSDEEKKQKSKKNSRRNNNKKRNKKRRNKNRNKKKGSQNKNMEGEKGSTNMSASAEELDTAIEMKNLSGLSEDYLLTLSPKAFMKIPMDILQTLTMDQVKAIMNNNIRTAKILLMSHGNKFNTTTMAGFVNKYNRNNTGGAPKVMISKLLETLGNPENYTKEDLEIIKDYICKIDEDNITRIMDKNASLYLYNILKMRLQNATMKCKASEKRRNQDQQSENQKARKMSDGEDAKIAEKMDNKMKNMKEERRNGCPRIKSLMKAVMGNVFGNDSSKWSQDDLVNLGPFLCKMPKKDLQSLNSANLAVAIGNLTETNQLGCCGGPSASVIKEKLLQNAYAPRDIADIYETIMSLGPFVCYITRKDLKLIPEAMRNVGFYKELEKFLASRPDPKCKSAVKIINKATWKLLDPSNLTKETIKENIDTIRQSSKTFLEKLIQSESLDKETLFELAAEDMPCTKARPLVNYWFDNFNNNSTSIDIESYPPGLIDCLPVEQMNELPGDVVSKRMLKKDTEEMSPVQRTVIKEKAKSGMPKNIPDAGFDGALATSFSTTKADTGKLKQEDHEKAWKHLPPREPLKIMAFEKLIEKKNVSLKMLQEDPGLCARLTLFAIEAFDDSQSFDILAACKYSPFYINSGVVYRLIDNLRQFINESMYYDYDEEIDDEDYEEYDQYSNAYNEQDPDLKNLLTFMKPERIEMLPSQAVCALSGGISLLTEEGKMSAAIALGDTPLEIYLLCPRSQRQEMVRAAVDRETISLEAIFDLGKAIIDLPPKVVQRMDMDMFEEFLAKLTNVDETDELQGGTEKADVEIVSVPSLTSSMADALMKKVENYFGPPEEWKEDMMVTLRCLLQYLPEDKINKIPDEVLATYSCPGILQETRKSLQVEAKRLESFLEEDAGEEVKMNKELARKLEMKIAGAIRELEKEIEEPEKRRKKRATSKITCEDIRNNNEKGGTIYSVSDINNMDTQQVVDCVEEIGSKMLDQQRGEAFWNKIKLEKPWETDDTFLNKIGYLSPWVTAAEIEALPLKSVEAIQNFGNNIGDDKEKAVAMAKSVKKYYQKAIDKYTPADLSAMSKMVCGMDVEDVKKIPKKSIVSSKIVSQLKACDTSTMQELAKAMTSEEGYGPVKDWGSAQVNEIGTVITGLLPNQFQQLSPKAISGLSADVAPKMPKDLLKKVSSAQITYLQPDFASNLSEDQLSALPDETRQLISKITTASPESLKKLQCLFKPDDCNSARTLSCSVLLGIVVLLTKLLEPGRTLMT